MKSRETIGDLFREAFDAPVSPSGGSIVPKKNLPRDITKPRSTSIKPTVAGTNGEDDINKLRAEGLRLDNEAKKKAAEDLAKKRTDDEAAKKRTDEKLAAEKLAAEKLAAEKLAAEKLAAENKTNAPAPTGVGTISTTPPIGRPTIVDKLKSKFGRSK